MSISEGYTVRVLLSKALLGRIPLHRVQDCEVVVRDAN
jgi:hypothetical protein